VPSINVRPTLKDPSALTAVATTGTRQLRLPPPLTRRLCCSWASSAASRGPSRDSCLHNRGSGWPAQGGRVQTMWCVKAHHAQRNGLALAHGRSPVQHGLLQNASGFSGTLPCCDCGRRGGGSCWHQAGIRRHGRCHATPGHCQPVRDGPVAGGPHVLPYCCHKPLARSCELIGRGQPPASQQLQNGAQAASHSLQAAAASTSHVSHQGWIRCCFKEQEMARVLLQREAACQQGRALSSCSGVPRHSHRHAKKANK